MTKVSHRAAIGVDGAVGSAPQSVGVSAFKPLGRNCPVCAGVRNDCRESPKTGLVHCRSALAAAGWRYIGDDSIGFGMYSDRPAAKDSADFAVRVEAAAKRKAAIAADKRAMSERALSVNVRDKQFTTIARHSGLSQSHRTKLEQRGYTPEQIERRYTEGRLCTWADDATIPGLSPDLPGATADGKLRRYGAGMAIAVTDENQRILGAQVRGDSGYFWISSFKIGGCSPALKNGENPIGFYRPDNGIFAAEIDLDEGFLKSDLTAELHGRLVLGAAGGNFAASPEQFERYLAAAARLSGSNLVILNADGGSQKNPSVVRTYSATAKLVESLGYEFRVRWWGQFEKADGDSDEIDSNKFNSAVLLSWADFEKFVPDVSKGFKAQVVDGGKTEAEPTKVEERDRLIAQRLFAFQQLKLTWEKTCKLTEASDRPLTRYDGSAADFDLDLKTARTIGIRGGLGSGKTEALIRAIVAEALRLGISGLVQGEKALQIVILNPTNGLCRQLEGRINAALLAVGISLPVLHFQDNVGAAREAMRDGYPGIYVMCKESFADYHMGDIDWSQVIVAIDEFSSFRQSAPGASDQLPDLIRMLTECKHLIALDRFFSDVDAKVLSLYRGRNRLLLAQNELKEKKLIHWIESITKQGLISLAHKGVALTLLGQWMVEGIPINRIAIASDSLLELKIIQQWLIASGCAKRRILISSETIEDAQLFMPDPDDMIRDAKIHYLLYSPTAQSGLDIQEAFERGILICTGVLPPTLMIQMMGRCRQCNEWWVSAPRFSQDSALSFKSLDADKLKRWEYASENALIRLGAAKGDRRVQAWSGINQAVREIEKKFNSECVYELLTDGYETVETVEVEACQQWNDLRDIVKDEDARKRLRYDRVNGAELVNAKRPPSTDAEVGDIKAAKIYSKYPKYVGELRQAYCQWLTTQAPENERRITELGGIAAVESAIAKLMDNELELKEASNHATEALDVAQRIDDESKTPETNKRLAAASAEVSDLLSCAEECQTELKELNELVMVSKLGDSEFVSQMRLLSSSRIEKLYEGERARQNNEQDRANILHAMQTRFTSPASKRYQIYRNSEFFNRLSLEGLVQATDKDDWREIGLWVSGHNGSEDILSRFVAFKTDPELLELFPEIETLEGFFVVCKRILKGYGYQSSGGTVRQEVDGLHKNGSSRGRQRVSRTKSVYCVVFLLRESSGSALFKKLLPVLMDAIGERIERERELFKPKETGAVGRYERAPDIPKAA